MCFLRRKKKELAKQEVKQKDPKLSEMEEATRSISLMVKHKVTRFDETEAYVKALVDLHPEVKEHPAVRELQRREEEYLREKAGEN